TVDGFAERIKGSRRPTFCRDARRSAGRDRSGVGHDDQQSGEDHRAWQTRGRHREGDAGHSRGSSAERRMVDLNAVIDEALNLAYHGARAADESFNITMERDFGESIALIEVNPQDMTRVFLNIFSNGFYAATRR